jgi:DNA-binding MarR family transcriptional regulator
VNSYEKGFLTSDELKVIAAFREETSSSIPELSVATRLKPSQVKSAVDNLENKEYLKKTRIPGIRIIQTIKQPTPPKITYVKLTPAGQKIQREMLE